MLRRQVCWVCKHLKHQELALSGKKQMEGKKPETAEEQLSRVLDHYDLGGLNAVRRIERGFVDEVWRVDTDRGRYFLKRRHPRRRQSDCLVHAQHALIKWLQLAGFPAPTLVPTSSSETFLILEGELYEVEEYIDGKPYDHDRPEHLEAAAGTLGRYHLCVEGFAPSALRQRGRLYSPANSREILSHLGVAWQFDRDPALMQLARQLERQVDDLEDRFARHGDLPYLVIHGDYYAGNLLFEGARVVGVVDYDKANWQPRVAELAEALIYFASPRPGHLKHLVYPGFLDREPFFRFLQNYACVVNLEGIEMGALPDYIGCIWLSMSLRRLLERERHRPAEALEALQEVLALGTWASVDALQMVEIARAATKGFHYDKSHHL
jgi:homoserine kinase type II